jgi:cbb3-type cytochrome oxidase subunit 3
VNTTSLVPADSSGQLKALQELPLPEAVSYLPQTIGWAALAVLLLAALGVAIWYALRRHDQQRYRRAALAELASIEARLASADSDRDQRANALAAIPRLIKRTALAVAPREQVAALSGGEWLAFLQRTRGRFDARSGALLALASYAPPDVVAAISGRDATVLIDHTRDWIERHHVEV